MTTDELYPKDGADPQNPPNLSRQILVVDDDSDIRAIISSTLQKSGYKVDTAKDGADAWIILNEADYYLLITDYKMPRVDGLELISKLRAQDRVLLIIMVSGTMPLEQLNRRPGLRIDAMLEKPFTAAELLGTVQKVMEESIDAPPADLTLLQQKQEAATRSDVTLAVKTAPHGREHQKNSSHRILLVDDDRDVRQLSIDALTESGYDVEAVPDGSTGWQALQGNHFDLIITDNHMPKMTGLEMISKIRAAHIATPVIMATGHVPTLEFNRKPWLKPDAMLQRPFAVNDLLETVKNVLNSGNGKGAHGNVPG